MTDQELMTKIHSQLHAILERACRASSVPEPFLAAITANESGGDPKASRFEPAVFAKIGMAALGLKTFTDPSLSRDISQAEWIETAERAMTTLGFYGGLDALRQLSMSYSFTQLMGWHALEWKVSLAGFLGSDPDTHFHDALRLLAFFAQKYQLDLRSEFEPLFRCWNTGRPDGNTYDPNYVPRGLMRMKLYDKILSQGGNQ